MGVLDAEAIDDQVMELLGNLTVDDAIADLSPSQRDDLADLVGLYGPAEIQNAIARGRGVGRQAVSHSLQRATDRIKNTSALGALDEVVVDHSDPED